MPLFHYKYATGAGEVMEGEMEAATQEAVIKRLQAQGHIPIRADEVSGAVRKRAARRGLFAPRKVTRKDVTLFTLELSSLLRAGLALDKALELLVGLAENEPVRDTVGDIQTRVRGGAALSAAMEAQSGVFSRFYINMVRAGEVGGALEAALARLADFMERSRELRETVISALIYPVILVLVAIISLTVILAFVVPRFSQMFKDAGQALPLATQIVVTLGDFVQQYWWAMLLVVVGGFLFARQRLRDPEARLGWDARMLKLPLVGDLIAKIETARFTRTLGTLLSNGVTLLNAVSIAKEIIANQVVSRGVGRIANRIREGQGLAGPLLESNVFPMLAGQMLQVGEETGSLEEMLMRLTEMYEREVQTSVRRLVAVAEPILILGLGLMIAGIIMSILVAILSINELAL